MVGRLKPSPARRFGRAIGAALAAAVLVAGTAGAAVAAGQPTPSFFNTVEVPNDNLKPFKKWLSALQRYSKENKTHPRASCGHKNLEICSYDDWIAFLKTLVGKDKLTQIRAVNHRMNQAKYITDNTNWGKKDYWASPAEFMANFGDCEDYAIIKYLSLRKLGFTDDELRVVAVKDLNLKVGHAILIVFWVDPRSGHKRALVLDNQIPKVVDARAIRHYQPVFSINGVHWWRHRAG